MHVESNDYNVHSQMYSHKGKMTLYMVSPHEHFLCINMFFKTIWNQQEDKE